MRLILSEKAKRRQNSFNEWSDS